MKLQTPSQQMKNRSHPPSCTQTKTEVWCAIGTVLLPPQETVGGRSSRLEATDYWDRVGTLVKNWYNEKPTGWVEECVFVFMCRGFNGAGGDEREREYYPLLSFSVHARIKNLLPQKAVCTKIDEREPDFQTQSQDTINDAFHPAAANHGRCQARFVEKLLTSYPRKLRCCCS